MVTKTRDLFTTVTIEGALLPPDILQRVTDGDTDLGGLHPEAYHLYGERLNEATNRAWNRLQGAWQAFKQAQERLPDDDIGTTITRERWLLVLFNALDFGRLDTATAVELDGKSYAISHRYKDVPIHLLSYKVDLDKRTPGVAGAATGSPHSMMQVFLNRMDEHLWGFLSNGYRLRILRDNLSLTRQAYIEFDLEAMMEGDTYSDFVLLYLLCHQSRVEAESLNEYWLEKWRKAAEEQGKRALDDLRDGVESAINSLGIGFLDHPHNTALRDALSDGSLDKQDYYRQLLRLVYRMLFLFVAEDRDLLHVSDATDGQRAIYQHYSTNKLRDLAADLRGTRHHDLFESLRLVMRLLGGEREGAEGLGLPVLGSFLFSDEAMPHLLNAKIANRDLLQAVRAISTVEDHEIRRLRRVDFKNLGSEELGSVYESLLELHPDINLTARTFVLQTAGGNERKTTGSYYTPTSLINALLDSALDPVLEEAIAAGGTRADIEERLLDLKVVDPACGSGHFLIAAANRMAKRLASVRTGEDEPTPEFVTEAKRDVIANCIYGVDLNEMAVELCKVNLWLESIDPGKPLTFLDAHIRQGNSLLGTTPALMARGIPEDTFPTKSGLIEGDDYPLVKKLRKRNRNELKDRQTGQMTFFDALPTDYTHLAQTFADLTHMSDDDLAAVHAKEDRFRQLADDPEYRKGKFLADLWCAAFVWHKDDDATYSLQPEVERPVPPPPTDATYRAIEKDPLADEHAERLAYTRYLAARYDFFHWHIAFPHIFPVDDDAPAADAETVTGWQGGFDCVLGNPPWERIKLQEKEWFAERHPQIANAPRASVRRKMIQQLKTSDDPHDRQLFRDFLEDKRKAAMESFFARNSGAYPLTGRGDINTYPLFAEKARHVIDPHGQAGIIVPSGIATDYSTQDFFSDLINSYSLHSFYDFENKEKIFPEVAPVMRFALMTMMGDERHSSGGADIVFFAINTAELQIEERHFRLHLKDVSLINPNTGNSPIFRNKREAEITRQIYRNAVVIMNERLESNPWTVTYVRMFDMTNDNSLFETKQNLEKLAFELNGNRYHREKEIYLPLYEAKFINIYDHRNGTFDEMDDIFKTRAGTHTPSKIEKANPNYLTIPRYWISRNDVEENFPENWHHSWFVAFRNVIQPMTNARCAMFTIIPRVGSGNSSPLLLSFEQMPKPITFMSNLNSFIFDFVTRLKMGGSNLNYYIIKQLPVIPPHTYTDTLLAFIVPRVLELTYTAWDLQAFAQDVGYDGAPFIWDDERRFWLRAELDALYFHLYGIPREDVAYIMETFPIVKRKDIAATAGSPHPLNPPLPTTRSSLGEGDLTGSDDGEENEGYYRTKWAILQIYDDMAQLPTLEVPAPKGEGTITVPDVRQYQPALSPPPADPSVAHEDTRGEE